ncbi:MAG: protein-ADP-ribose hydrolase, partial [Parasporobacterium sp.]|nr:protein-ADP-ribose hydrolase [Parasporobacterium sp.]
MNQNEKRQFLIRALLEERPEHQTIAIPHNVEDQKRLLRSLMNVRMPGRISEDFLNVQDAYLQEAVKEKGITDLSELEPVEEGIYVWQGDITTLRCDAIVNAANSGMTGCYVPCHGC